MKGLVNGAILVITDINEFDAVAKLITSLKNTLIPRIMDTAFRHTLLCLTLSKRQFLITAISTWLLITSRPNVTRGRNILPKCKTSTFTHYYNSDRFETLFKLKYDIWLNFNFISNCHFLIFGKAGTIMINKIVDDTVMLTIVLLTYILLGDIYKRTTINIVWKFFLYYGMYHIVISCLYHISCLGPLREQSLNVSLTTIKMCKVFVLLTFISALLYSYCGVLNYIYIRDRRKNLGLSVFQELCHLPQFVKCA